MLLPPALRGTEKFGNWLEVAQQEAQSRPVIPAARCLDRLQPRALGRGSKGRPTRSLAGLRGQKWGTGQGWGSPNSH